MDLQKIDNLNKNIVQLEEIKKKFVDGVNGIEKVNLVACDRYGNVIIENDLLSKSLVEHVNSKETRERLHDIAEKIVSKLAKDATGQVMDILTYCHNATK